MHTNITKGKIKEIVREKYGQLAQQAGDGNAASCGSGGCGCSGVDATVMAEDYSSVGGYVADADLGLGCGLPTEFAAIRPGDVVVDLGSGAGNDAFVARSVVGAHGKVIGVDFTQQMIDRARVNASKLGFNNVEFRHGDIENIPIAEEVADVVVSNCVLNLVPDKARAFAEIFRILKRGGHFSVSDIVIKGDLPSGLRESAEMYAGCVSGAIEKEDYLGHIGQAGFIRVAVQKERKITIPKEILSLYLDSSELERHQSGAVGVYSITVYGEKPVS